MDTMDSNDRETSNRDHCKLMELMNDDELRELLDWENDPDSREDPDLFGVSTSEQKALEILRGALKREMSKETVDWKRVQTYITTCPTLCGDKWEEYKKDDETTALYHAIKKHAPLDVIMAILKGFPDAIQKRDNDGNTPLHCACQVKAQPALVEELSCRYPDATEIRNNDGCKPREYALESNQSPDVIRWLYKDWPSIETINRDSRDIQIERALYRLLSNDGYLQQLNLDGHGGHYCQDTNYERALHALQFQKYLQQLTIAIYPDWTHCMFNCHRDIHKFMQALAQNTSIKHLTVEVNSIERFANHFGQALSGTLVLPNLEKLSVHNRWIQGEMPSVDQIRALVDLVKHDRRIKTFEIDNVCMNDESGVLFAETIHGNTTIQHLELGRNSFSSASSALAFVRALPTTHCLQSIHFTAEEHTWYSEREVVPTIIQVLGHTKLRTIAITGLYLQDEIVERILDTLRQIAHHYIKVDVVYSTAWKRKIQQETYRNHELFIRRKWMDKYLQRITREATNHDHFLAIMHAKKADDEQPFPTPNILYTLMKEVATSKEVIMMIGDAFHSHYGKKRPESYFTTDSKGVPRKRVRDIDD